MKGKKRWISAAVLMLALAVAAGAGYLCSFAGIPDLKNLRMTEDPSGNITVGSVRTLCWEAELPLHAADLEVSLQTPENTVQCGETEIRKHYRWNHWRLTGKIRLMGLNPGEGKGGRIVFALRDKNIPPEQREIASFAVLPGESSGNELQLAGELPEPRFSRGAVWAGIAVALLLLAAAGMFLRRIFRQKKRTEPVLPPWVLAERELVRLEADLTLGKLLPERAFSLLTDLVRKYLENRYGLPVTSRTTDEFMEGLRKGSPLPETAQPFLRDFLASADQIKFARVPAGEPEIRSAVSGARNLVKQTVPPVEPGEGGHHV